MLPKNLKAPKALDSNQALVAAACPIHATHVILQEHAGIIDNINAQKQHQKIRQSLPNVHFDWWVRFTCSLQKLRAVAILVTCDEVDGYFGACTQDVAAKSWRK